MIDGNIALRKGLSRDTTLLAKISPRQVSTSVVSVYWQHQNFIIFKNYGRPQPMMGKSLGILSLIESRGREVFGKFELLLQRFGTIDEFLHLGILS